MQAFGHLPVEVRQRDTSFGAKPQIDHEAIFLVRNPVSPRRSLTSVALRSPAITTSVRDRATCAQTKACPSHRFWVRMAMLPEWRSVGSGAAAALGARN